MGSHIFSNFRSSSHHQSLIIQVLMTTCNHSISLRGTCSSIMIFFIFRNNPTKGQTGSGIYTSDGVTFKSILVTIFHFSILNDLGRFLEKNGMVKSDNEKNSTHHFAQRGILAQHVWPGAQLLPQPHLQLHQTTHCQSACCTCQVHPSKHLTCHFLKKKVQAERQKRTENGKQTVLFHRDPR